MAQSVGFAYLMACLLAGIATIVILTVKFRVHAFFALILACFVVGISMQMPVQTIVELIKEGFGNIMKSLSMIIILGTALGVLLEYSGSTSVMASWILKIVGERRAALSLSLTGLVAGLPLFCDSGYVVLSGLNKPLAKRTGIPVTTLSVCLATGLYAIHCLIPPHPGASAAAGLVGVDLGKLIATGILIAIPAMSTGYFWAVYAGKRYRDIPADISREAADSKQENLPGVFRSFLPVLVPILLIAGRSFISLEQKEASAWENILLVLGNPVIALIAGLLLALANISRDRRPALNSLLEESIVKAGVILVIIGGGGAFGSVLAAAHIGDSFRETLPLTSMGIFFPFLLTSLLKTAQGSSTVAIITAASIVLPLLPALGLSSPDGRMLAVLSMGAGSMTISHANDAYFWVIARFSGLDMKAMLRVYSLATLFMGLVSLAMIYLLSFM